MLERILRERRFFELGAAQRRLRDLWRRLRFVLDQCRAWEEAGGGTLRGYLHWIEGQSGEGSRVIETVLPESDDGRAVHGVLQTVDLATGDGLVEACAAQAAAEGALGRENVIEALCRSALSSGVVQRAASCKHWREVYVGVPYDDGVLEGFIDLLHEDDDGLPVSGSVPGRAYRRSAGTSPQEWTPRWRRRPPLRRTAPMRQRWTVLLSASQLSMFRLTSPRKWPNNVGLLFESPSASRAPRC